MLVLRREKTIMLLHSAAVTIINEVVIKAQMVFRC